MPKAGSAYDVTVVVVSANDGRWLARCLTTVYAHAGDARVQAIVVDSGCTDETRTIVARDFPQAELIAATNAGFGYANNRGIEASDARYVLFLNPDTEILTGTLGELVRALDARPQVGLAGVRQLTGDGELYPSMRRFPSALRALGEALGSERWPLRPAWAGERVLNRRAYAHEQLCDWTVGAFMLARRTALQSAGVMDERFFLMCEEPDLCLRLRHAGWEVRHLPTMEIVHHAGKAGRSARMAAQDTYARRQYAQKHFSPLHRGFYLGAIGLRHLLRAAVPDVTACGRARRTAARGAIRALTHPAEPPFLAPPQTALWPSPPRGPEPVR